MWGLLMTPATTKYASLVDKRTQQRFLLIMSLVPLSVAVFLAVRRSGLDAAENG